MKQLKKTLLTLVALIALTTHAWAQTGENIFQYCYDCQRDPAYPKTTASASLSGFANPNVGYKGSGFDAGNTPAGPWKLEYVGLWSTTDNHGIEDFRVSNYQDTYNCTDVPVFRLYQWNATANEYQHASYGVVCCYAKVSNAVEHTALFEAQDGWGCVLTNSSHSSSMNITFDEDLSTGLATLIAAATPAASGTPVALNWDATAKTATLTNGMPAGNVTVSVEYFPQAEFAMSTGTTPEPLAPTAIADVPANTDDPIVTPGTVANIGTTDVKQGTLMYFVIQPTDNTIPTAPDYDTRGWSENVPTANELKQGDVYVWYYIKGAEPATIADRTDDNTRSDSDIKPLGTNGYVTLEAEPTYDVTLNDEGLSTDESAAWKVAKGTDDPAAFPLEGVKKGETVTVTYTGDRKVIGVKAEKKSATTPLDNTTTAWTAGTYAVPAGGLTYSAAITVSGEVTLVLTDGETLTLNKGISLAEGATLTVEGNGTMNINGTNDNTSSTVAGSGMMCFKSGTLVATGGNGHVGNDLGQYGMNGGISHGGSAINGSLTLEGGNVTATGGNGGNAGGANSINCATGGNGGSAITGNVIINGGNWTANDGSNGTLLPGGTSNVAGTGGKAVAGTVTDNRN